MRKKVLEFFRESGLRVAGEEVLEMLVKGSSLTEAQAETLLVELASQATGGKLSVEDRASIRGVSKGAYARTKRQALDNIRRSIYTILLLRYLGILGNGGLAALMEAAELLARGEADEALGKLEQMTLRDITE